MQQETNGQRLARLRLEWDAQEEPDREDWQWLLSQAEGRIAVEAELALAVRANQSMGIVQNEMLANWNSLERELTELRQSLEVAQ